MKQVIQSCFTIFIDFGTARSPTPAFVTDFVTSHHRRQSGKENAVALVADLRVVDGGALGVGYKSEAMARALGGGGGDGDGHCADLQETSREGIHGVMNFGELIYDSAPLNVDGIDVAAHISQGPVRAQAIRDGKGIVNRADVFRVEPGLTTLQIDFAAE